VVRLAKWDALAHQVFGEVGGEHFGHEGAGHVFAVDGECGESAGGDRQGAAAAIPDEMVLATTLIGTAEMVRDRLAGWAAAGVDTVRLYPAGDTLDERLDTRGRALDLVP